MQAFHAGINKVWSLFTEEWFTLKCFSRGWCCFPGGWHPPSTGVLGVSTYCLTDVTRATPRDGQHPYITIAVSLPEEELNANETKKGDKKDKSEEPLREPIKYCR